MVSRRSLLATGAGLLGAPFVNLGRFRLFGNDREYSAQTIDLIQSSLVIDMLGLLTLDYRKLCDWEAHPDRLSLAELQRFKASGINVFHPAVGFVDGDVYRESFSDITGWNLLIASHPDQFLRIDRPDDLATAKRLGKIGIVIGLQNSEHFRTIGDVDQFYTMGQRVSQLTYHPNRLGGGSNDPRDPGLTPFGAQIVDRMNRLGMAIDISHCADTTTLDAIEASTKPILITHSNCRAIVKTSARCKTDVAIRKMAAKGGVMGVSMVRYFVGSSASVTIENVLDHIDHIAGLVGIEHVGIGSDVDFDGRDRGSAVSRKNDLDELRYQTKIFDLTEGLLRRKYSPAGIASVLGGNFQRALSSIWA